MFHYIYINQEIILLRYEEIYMKGLPCDIKGLIQMFSTRIMKLYIYMFLPVNMKGYIHMFLPARYEVIHLDVFTPQYDWMHPDVFTGWLPGLRQGPPRWRPWSYRTWADHTVGIMYRL